MTWDRIKRLLKIIAGFALLPIGVLMLPLPGPGWLVIFLALAILAGEFVWARNLMDRLKEIGAKLDPEEEEAVVGYVAGLPPRSHGRRAEPATRYAASARNVTTSTSRYAGSAGSSACTGVTP